ncbi:TolC family protein [Sphingomonas sp. LB-2]|uniref:TolC family protein n=1 Tax=Sphingomonas caeni TaxID=2984949 RepID=UPI002230ED97|nr:TolC family protein [Sphingomonas caeni]MCW3847909.1 TolC family protein [Sphingomonas caeni]
MRLLFLAPLLAALPSAAFADPLTFDEALTLAVGQAPSLRARSLDVDARRSSVIPAGQLPDPKLSFGLDNFPVSGPPAFTFGGDEMTMARVGISQDLPNPGKRRARTGFATAGVGVAEAAQMAERRRVRIAVALAWIDLAYAERRLALIDSVLVELRELVSAATSAVTSGTVRPAQALETRQAISRLEDRRSEIAAEVARARAILSRWTGDPNPQIEGAIPEFAIDPAALRAAIDQNPELAVAMARTRQSEASVEVARADKRPDWGFDVSYQRRYPRYGDMVSVGVRVDLPLFTRRRQDPMIAASTASAGAARADQEDLRRALVADLEAGLADHAMHHEQWMRARDELLPLARQRADLEIVSYSAGRATLIDVIAAQSMFADAGLLALDREALVARDGARLVLTYGSDQ